VVIIRPSIENMYFKNADYNIGIPVLFTSIKCRKRTNIDVYDVPNILSYVIITHWDVETEIYSVPGMS
jgi:hypothetical protein